jgi:hypothetical protein
MTDHRLGGFRLVSALCGDRTHQVVDGLFDLFDARTWVIVIDLLPFSFLREGVLLRVCFCVFSLEGDVFLGEERGHWGSQRFGDDG